MTNLLTLKRCILAFKNLSTIVLIRYLGKGYPSDYTGPTSRALRPSWNEAKGLAISQLGGSLVDGPKKLKTVMVWGVGGNPEPGLVTGEIIV